MALDFWYIRACRYIFSLALADLLVIVICVPSASLIYTLDSWPWGTALCRVTECAKDISIGVSVFTLTALSAERYYAVVNPLRRLQVRLLYVTCYRLHAFLSYYYFTIWQQFSPISLLNGNAFFTGRLQSF